MPQRSSWRRSALGPPTSWCGGRRDYAQEDEAIREIVAAFEQETGKQVELVLDVQEEFLADLVAALEAGRRTPDFVFTVVDIPQTERWAYEGRLVDLSDAVGHFSGLFDREALERSNLLDGSTGRRGLYFLPLGLASHHVHVWKSLLERAGFTLTDIPKEWDAFWSFWCDHVQPAVRKKLDRDDIWGIGLPMSTTGDTGTGIWQFIAAYEADYVARDGRLVIDDPEVRRRLIQAIDSYTGVYRKGCTPPDSVTWSIYDNNASFLAQTTVMTVNPTLSIPNALKGERSEDYYENAITIDWPWRRVWTGATARDQSQSRRRFQGRRQRRQRQGVRALPGRRGLACALSQLFRRAHAAGDAEAARPAVLARPERPAPNALCNAASDPAALLQLRNCLRRLAAWRSMVCLAGSRPSRRRRGHQP